MHRSFRIPLGLAALGLVGCNSTDENESEADTDTDTDADSDTDTDADTDADTDPQRMFEGTWDITSQEYGGQVFAFPYTYGGQTTELGFEISAATLSLNIVTSYDTGGSNSYTEGPFSWTTNNEGRLSVANWPGASFFVCDHDPLTDTDSLKCRLQPMGAQPPIDLNAERRQ